MDYLALLEHSFVVSKEVGECWPESRFEYLSDNIFDFTTYDMEMSVLFARKAVEVCSAINSRSTFDYIASPSDYQWFLLMCNMPFFADKLEWGSSIRGAWWRNDSIEFASCGLWVGNEQLCKTIEFSRSEWEKFIDAIIEFSS